MGKHPFPIRSTLSFTLFLPFIRLSIGSTQSSLASSAPSTTSDPLYPLPSTRAAHPVSEPASPRASLDTGVIGLYQIIALPPLRLLVPPLAKPVREWVTYFVYIVEQQYRSVPGLCRPENIYCEEIWKKFSSILCFHGALRRAA